MNTPINKNTSDLIDAYVKYLTEVNMNINNDTRFVNKEFADSYVLLSSIIEDINKNIKSSIDFTKNNRGFFEKLLINFGLKQDIERELVILYKEFIRCEILFSKYTERFIERGKGWNMLKNNEIKQCKEPVRSVISLFNDKNTSDEVKNIYLNTINKYVSKHINAINSNT